MMSEHKTAPTNAAGRGVTHTASPEIRRQVEALAGFGIPQPDIAALVGLGSINTLKKYYDAELRLGEIKANAKVVESLFRKATSDTHPQAATCAIFWCKTRLRWKETVEHNHHSVSNPEAADELMRRFEERIGKVLARRSGDLAKLIEGSVA